MDGADSESEPKLAGNCQDYVIFTYNLNKPNIPNFIQTE